MAELPHEARHTIATLAEHYFTESLESLDQSSTTTDSTEYIQEGVDDGANAIDLDLDEQLRVVEQLNDAYGIGDLDLTLHNLRQRIEGMASYLLHCAAQSRAITAVESLDHILNAHRFSWDQVSLTNHCAMLSHRSERLEEHGTVYEYRQIEGERNLDIWEIRLQVGSVFVTDEISSS